MSKKEGIKQQLLPSLNVKIQQLHHELKNRFHKEKTLYCRDTTQQIYSLADEIDGIKEQLANKSLYDEDLCKQNLIKQKLKKTDCIQELAAKIAKGKKKEKELAFEEIELDKDIQLCKAKLQAFRVDHIATHVDTQETFITGPKVEGADINLQSVLSADRGSSKEKLQDILSTYRATKEKLSISISRSNDQSSLLTSRKKRLTYQEKTLALSNPHWRKILNLFSEIRKQDCSEFAGILLKQCGNGTEIDRKKVFDGFSAHNFFNELFKQKHIHGKFQQLQQKLLS